MGLVSPHDTWCRGSRAERIAPGTVVSLTRWAGSLATVGAR